MKTKPQQTPEYSQFPYPKLIISRPVRRILQYAIVKVLLVFVGMISVPFSQRIGRWLGLLLFPLLKRDRGICEYQLEMIYPDKTKKERLEIAKGSFQHMGMTLFEVLSLPKIRRNPTYWVKMEGEDVLRSVYGRGLGVILVTGHMGNWELFSIVFEMLKIPAQAIVRSIVNTRLNDLIIRKRSSEFLRPVQRGSKESPRQILNCLKNGDVLLVALDHDTNVPSVFVNFFGLPANTPRVAASLALKKGVPLLTGFDQRLEDGTHLFRFQEVQVPEDIKNDKEGTLRLTQIIASAIEDQIRQYPEQWTWSHRRWKRRPSPDIS